MSKERILILGDSSIPPREELPYELTYSSKLKRKLSEYTIEVNAKTGTSSRKLFKGLDAFMLYGFAPENIVLNYGIVDVYPRPYPNIVYRFLGCSGLLKYVDKFLKKSHLYYSLGNIFNFKEVNKQDFANYSDAIINQLLKKGTKRIILIGIIRPYKVLLKSKHVEREIVAYNSILQELSKKYKEVSYIDMYDVSDESFVIWDGYHYSEQASIYLAEQIEKLVKNA